ncbi:FAST kinase domain-containing protein 4 [Schistocerca cancellata]|uniref:FAST kinase domain-containing protein 4 n=1 Tax=Schistocerca cancellata TaxID=274614 RepID=UPI0021180E2A|nr:FAST kinase domain-containing protein 4 [Schistocerca cancellata]
MIFRSIMLRSVSMSSWRGLLRATALPLTRLSSSSATAATGPVAVPCEAEDTSDKTAEEASQAVGSATAPGGSQPALGTARRKALVAAAMELSSPGAPLAEEAPGGTAPKEKKTAEPSSAPTKQPATPVDKREIKRPRKGPAMATLSATGDLSVILGITGDDEAARMVPSLSTDQKIRVLSKLSSQRRRSVTLLRSLAASITAQSEPLGLKRAADVLYAAATLNFPDGPLLERAVSDAGTALSSGSAGAEGKAAAVRSVATSVGLLRYRDIELMEHMSDWVLSQLHSCRPQDLTAVLLTFAAVNYVPSNADEFFQAVLPLLREADFPGPSMWLDTVWSLCVLGRATPEQTASVLSPEFLLRLARTSGRADSLGEIPPGSKLKLLNVNAVSQYLLPNYKGPLLSPTSDVAAVPIARTKARQALVASVLDALTNLLPSATYLRSSVNTGMGFLLDAECLIDSKCNPLPLPQPDNKSSPPRSFDRKGSKVAVLVWSYAEVCRGRGSPPPPAGPAALAERLLTARGYRILRVHHAEFAGVGDSLVKRVQFLERRLKQLATAPSPNG